MLCKCSIFLEFQFSAFRNFCKTDFYNVDVISDDICFPWRVIYFIDWLIDWLRGWSAAAPPRWGCGRRCGGWGCWGWLWTRPSAPAHSSRSPAAGLHQPQEGKRVFKVRFGLLHAEIRSSSRFGLVFKFWSDRLQVLVRSSLSFGPIVFKFWSGRLSVDFLSSVRIRFCRLHIDLVVLK